MTDVTKLIEELESAHNRLEAVEYPSGTEEDLIPLLARTIDALRELATPSNGIGPGEIPYKIITELYNAAVQGTHLPPAKGLTVGRKRMIAQRWGEDKSHQNIQWWTDYWKRIAASDFLAGRTPPTPGHENWRPNFDWFIMPRNLLKIVEGSYDNRAPRSNVESIARFR